MKLKEFLSRYAPLALWSGLIFFLSSLPGKDVSSVDSVNYIAHKIPHLIEYSFLFYFSFRAFGNKLYAGIFVILFAISDEFHQTFVPGRHGRVSDIFVDSFGLLIGYWGVIYEKEALNYAAKIFKRNG